MARIDARGYTLIEILVVTGIIAVLIGLLFPVFSMAQRKIQATTCLNNQRQITQMVIADTQDHQETLPTRDAMWSTMRAKLPASLFACSLQRRRSEARYAYNGHIAGKNLGEFPKISEMLVMADAATGVNIALLPSQLSYRHSGRTAFAGYLDGHVGAITRETTELSYLGEMYLQSYDDFRTMLGISIVKDYHVYYSSSGFIPEGHQPSARSMSASEPLFCAEFSLLPRAMVRGLWNDISLADVRWHYMFAPRRNYNKRLLMPNSIEMDCMHSEQTNTDIFKPARHAPVPGVILVFRTLVPPPPETAGNMQKQPLDPVAVERFRIAVFHSIYHSLEWFNRFAISDDAWTALGTAQPPSMSWQNMRIWKIDNTLKGYLCMAGALAPSEDCATFFTFLMIDPEYVEERGKEDPLIAAKAALMKQRLARFYPSMDSTYWDFLKRYRASRRITHLTSHMDQEDLLTQDEVIPMEVE